jgi:epoxyqueuosine reductase
MNPTHPPGELSEWIRSHAALHGFAACGITGAGYQAEEAARLEHWLALGWNGTMSYLASNKEKRLQPSKVLPGARSVILFLVNYKPPKVMSKEDNYRIARYAYGKDYHYVFRKKLHAFAAELAAYAGPFTYRAFTDSAPVLEKALAVNAGLGWIGKNTCLIHPAHGSFVFIGEIISDLELEPDMVKINDRCGGCSRCVDQCPTRALKGDYTMDARQCIAYITIEYRGRIPAEFQGKMNDWIFGCDICQEVCPWNRETPSHREPEFSPARELMEMNREKWRDLDETAFDGLFKDSAVQRAGFISLTRNIHFVSESFE